MARYKSIPTTKVSSSPISFTNRLSPASFEFALNDIVDNVLDLSVFEGRFCND